MLISIIVPKTKTGRKKINSTHHSVCSLCRKSIINLHSGKVVVGGGSGVVLHGMTQLPRYGSVLRLAPKGQATPEVGDGRTLVLYGATYPRPVPFVEHDLGELSLVFVYDVMFIATKVGANREEAMNNYYIVPGIIGTPTLLAVIDGKKTVYSFTEDATWDLMKFKTVEQLRQFAIENAVIFDD